MTVIHQDDLGVSGARNSVAGIHVLLADEGVDGRDEPGHDDFRNVCLRRPVDARELPLGDAHRRLGVLAAGAVAREHVDEHEVGDRRRRALADRTFAAGRQAPLGDVAIDGALPGLPSTPGWRRRR